MTQSLHASPIRILPLGDSITQGSNDQPGGYRGFLERYLIASNVAFEFVGNQQVNSEGMRDPRHEGHPGASIERLRLGRDELPRCAAIGENLQVHRPDCVLLLAGTNDLYFACPEKATSDLSQLIEEMFQSSPNLSIILGTLLPILPGPKFWGSVVPEDVTDRVNDFNGRLAQLVQAQAGEGKSIFLADFSSCVESAEDLLDDGVHPKARVMERMAKIWHKSLIRLLEGKVQRTL